MYMGVIPFQLQLWLVKICAPHVYGGDPIRTPTFYTCPTCSPCIWG